MHYHAPLTTFLLTILAYASLVSAISIPTMKGSFQAPSVLQDWSPFSAPRQTALRTPSSSECTNGGALYCCPSFIQSGIDGPCGTPLKVDMVQQCRKEVPHGMACCINEVCISSATLYTVRFTCTNVAGSGVWNGIVGLSEELIILVFWRFGREVGYTRVSCYGIA